MFQNSACPWAYHRLKPLIECVNAISLLLRVLLRCLYQFEQIFNIIGPITAMVGWQEQWKRPGTVPRDLTQCQAANQKAQKAQVVQAMLLGRKEALMAKKGSG